MNISNLYYSFSFIINTFQIMTIEYIRYLLFANKQMCIDNIAKKMINENMLCVKIFQSVSMHHHIIDETINQQLIKYTDSVPYTTDDIDWNTFHAIFSNNNPYIKSMPTEPINAGMISLTYKVESSITNQPLILKIKRKNIDVYLKQDIEKLQSLIKLLSLIPAFHKLNLTTTINENIYSMEQQLDFTQEVKNIQLMGMKYNHLSYITIPTVYESFTQTYKNAILMEYIQGDSIANVIVSDYPMYAKLLIKFGIASMYNGVAHGDLHSGNIIFIKEPDANTYTYNYKLGIIDFGILSHIDENISLSIIELLPHITAKDYCKITDSMLDMIIDSKDTFRLLDLQQQQQIYSSTKKIIEQSFERQMVSHIELYKFLYILNNYIEYNDLHKYGLTIKKSIINLQISVAMVNGLCSCLCKDKYIELVNECIQEVFPIHLLNDDD